VKIALTALQELAGLPKDTIKREIHELQIIIQNMKEELNKDMENFRKKNQTEILEIKSPFVTQKTQ
jgi:DNA gyrase/topoisomerase IV subunit A